MLTLGILWRNNRSGSKETGRILNKLFKKIQETRNDLYVCIFKKMSLISI